MQLPCRGRALTSLANYGLWLNNTEVESVGGAEPAVVRNPANGNAVYTTALANEADVDLAVGSAKAAQPAWEAVGARVRGGILRRAADLLRSRLARLIDLETAATGRPVREYRAQLGRVPEWLEYHASVAESSEGSMPPFGGAIDHIALVRRRALGVCGLITPFNHPLLISTKKVAVALATGNTCVVKPPEVAPASVVELAKCIAEAGAPPGVINVVTGNGKTAGGRLAQHDDVAKIDFTGGTVVGRALGAVCGAKTKHYCAELGGNCAVIVSEDVVVKEAVDGVAFGAFIASGQTCVSAKRILVHRHIFGEFRDSLVAKTNALVLGDPADPATQIGPLISIAARDAVAAQVDCARRDGAIILAGGKSPDLARCPLARIGAFYEPTVLANVDPAAACFQEEIFGPVVSLVPFEDDDHAIQLANNNQYALGAAVWTRDLKRAHTLVRRVKAGIIWVNAHHRNAPDAPWGGFAASGIGRENGLEAHREYTAPYTTVIRTAGDPEDWFTTDLAQPTRYG